MRRWISFGIVVLVACVAVANLTGPGAWASDSHASYMTVPTRTPKPRNTAVPPKEKQPTNTPQPAPANTNTPAIVNPTRVSTVVQPTGTAAAQVASTAAVAAETVEASSTPIVTPTEQATPTATGSVELTPTANSESISAATTLSTPTVGGANAAPAADQPESSASGGDAPGLWLLVVAVALMIFGGVLFFGRRRAKGSDK